MNCTSPAARLACVWCISTGLRRCAKEIKPVQGHDHVRRDAPASACQTFARIGALVHGYTWQGSSTHMMHACVCTAGMALYLGHTKIFGPHMKNSLDCQ